MLKWASKGLHSLAVSDANVYTTLAVSDAFLLISEKSHLGHFHSGEGGKGCACTHVRGCSSGERRCGVQLLSGAGKQRQFFCYWGSGNACNLTFLLRHCHATKHKLLGSILRGCVRWHLLFYLLAWVPLPWFQHLRFQMSPVLFCARCYLGWANYHFGVTVRETIWCHHLQYLTEPSCSLQYETSLPPSLSPQIMAFQQSAQESSTRS